MNFSVGRACIIFFVVFWALSRRSCWECEFMALRTFVDEARVVRFHRLAVKCYRSVVGRAEDTVW